MTPALAAPRPHLAVLQIALVYAAVRAFWMVSDASWVARQSPLVETLVKLGLWVAPCVLLLALRSGTSPRAAWRDLGLGGAPWRGLGFAALVTAPMAFAAMLTPHARPGLDLLVDSVFVGPFAEEVLFRGFLCVQLIRLAGWRIWPAIAVSSAIFALAHLRYIDFWLYGVLRGPNGPGVQASGGPDGWAVTVISPFEMWGWLISQRLDDVVLYGAPYAFAGVLFAWIAWRWQSLWPAVGLHVCINLWWGLVSGDARLQFDITPMTIAHTLTIALAIGVTLIRFRPAIRLAPSNLERA